MKKVTMQEFAKAKRELMDLAYERYGHTIELYVEDNDPAEPVTVNVNWAAIGTQTPEETKRFSDNLAEAAELAETFPYNGAKLANYETAEFWDDMFYTIDDEDEEDENLPSLEDVLASIDLPRLDDVLPGLDFIEFNGHCGGQFLMNRSIPIEVEVAWDREATGENLIVDIEDLDCERDRAEVNSHLDGYGSALALMSSINKQYPLNPGDLQVNINMVRMEQLLVDYNMVLDRLPDAPSKWAMANAWAYTIDQHLEEEEYVPGIGIDKPEWLERMVFAEGDFAGYHVTIIYTIDKKEEE